AMSKAIFRNEFTDIVDDILNEGKQKSKEIVFLDNDFKCQSINYYALVNYGCGGIEGYKKCEICDFKR
ncbi:unnamed protein product, partial [marine sediment metagenome]